MLPVPRNSIKHQASLCQATRRGDFRRCRATAAQEKGTAPGTCAARPRQAIAGEYARHRVRANAICPHGIITGRARDHFAKEGIPDVREVPAIRDLVLQYPNAISEPEDIAHIALFLASDESRILNGTIIEADGGSRLSHKSDEVYGSFAGAGFAPAATSAANA